MKHLKIYENWAKNLYYNVKFRNHRVVFDENVEKLENIGFVFKPDKLGGSSIGIYNSNSENKNIKIEFKFESQLGMDPGRDIFKVIINKKHVEWFDYIEDAIEYIEYNIPKLDKEIDKYNL